MEDVEPTCDICGRHMDDSPAAWAFVDADWNGETGNHETCEARHCMDPRHGTPCPLPCDACADEGCLIGGVA